MSNLMIPGPGAEPEKTGQEEAQGNGPAAGADRQQQQQQKRAEKTDIPSEEDCLRTIAHAGRLAALGVLKPAVVSAVRSCFREVLQHHKAKAKETEKNIASDDVLEALRSDPKMFNLLEPLLSQSQIDLIMKNA